LRKGQVKEKEEEEEEEKEEEEVVKVGIVCSRVVGFTSSVVKRQCKT